MIRLNPSLLLDLQSQNLIDYANSFLTRSVGIEIECTLKHLNEAEFCDKLLVVEQDHDHEELRFRIYPGIQGLINLYQISKALNKYAIPNLRSGIHYHVDVNHENSEIMQKYKHDFNSYDWMLSIIKSWNYTGTYNAHEVGHFKSCAIRIGTSYNTIEFRVGEMTFDYNVLLQRVLHVNNLVDKLVSEL